MDIDRILKELSISGGDVFSFNFISLLKIPVVLALIVNILFSVLLFLRVRILSDTFKSPQNKIVKAIVAGYVLLVVIGALVSLLFVILT
jgi:hypothetical protein